MFTVKSFSKPEFLPLELGDKVTWWSRRYKAYIVGQVVELTQKFRYSYYRDDAGWHTEPHPTERVYVRPDKNIPFGYPSYRLSFKASGLQKIS
jgi:hypothetical protein